MIHCLGINYRSAALDTRERVAVHATDVAAWLRDLRTGGVRESFLLSTCNRTEIFTSITDDAAIPSIEEVIERRVPGGAEIFRTHGYQHRDAAVVEHLFRVAASLDAMVVGEPQILGQVKAAYRVAEEAGTLGPTLRRLVPKAFHVAKRVRQETGIGERPVSVGSVAVALAEQILGDLSHRTVLLIGAGDIGRVTLQHLQMASVGRCMITNRTTARAAALAAQCGGESIPWESLVRGMAEADIVICGVGLEEAVVTRAAVAAARAVRSDPLVCIDLAIPRGIETSVGELPGCFLHDLDDLQAVAEANQAERVSVIEDAEAMVSDAAKRVWLDLRGESWQSAVATLHQKCEEIRQREVARTLHQLQGSPATVAAAIEQCSQSIVAKILHDPILQVKSEAMGSEEDVDRHRAQAGHWLRRLFALDG